MSTQNNSKGNTMNNELIAAVSAAILKGTRQGMTIAQAIDAVLGAGTYDQLAGEIYDALQN